MDRAGADAFVYARACGMYARTFVGSRAKKLFEVKRLQDLWTLVCEEEVPLVPEGMMALLLERKAEQQVVNDFIVLLSAYDKPDPVARALLSLYDYNNLKSVSAALALGNRDAPFMIDIGPYAIFDHTRWPDIAAMTAETSVSWYNRVPLQDEQVAWENRLDHDYYRSLWHAAKSLGVRDRSVTEDLIREEIVLQNIVWAMRLRCYYKKKTEEIIPMLAGSEEDAATVAQLCQPAIDALGKPEDSWEEWAGWKYIWILNPHEEGVPWSLDPRWAQFAADKYLYRRALSRFHQYPFTSAVLVSFFKIRQLEEQMIRVAAEGLRLGTTEEQMNEFMEGSRNV